MVRRLLLAALALAVVSTAQAQTFPTVDTAALVKRTAAGPETWDFTLVDVRSVLEFEEGHIPGALSIPAGTISDALPKAVTDRGREVVFYCSGPNCPGTHTASLAAAQAGYVKLAEYREGIPGWAGAQRPLEGRPNPPFNARRITASALNAQLTFGGMVLVDLRDPADFHAGHLRGAVNVPIDSIPEAVKKLPEGRLLLLDHAGHQAPVAARVLARLGRKDIFRLDGGMIAWRTAGLKVVTQD